MSTFLWDLRNNCSLLSALYYRRRIQTCQPPPLAMPALLFVSKIIIMKIGYRSGFFPSQQQRQA